MKCLYDTARRYAGQECAQSRSDGAKADAHRLRAATWLVALLALPALALARSAGTDPPLLAPGPGYAYVAVRQRTSSVRTGSAAIRGSPRGLLLDDRLAAHAELGWLDDAGRPLRDLRYSADEPAEHWQLFVPEADARPWRLVDPAGADNLPDLYYRLDASSDWAAPEPAVQPLPANAAGVAQPAEVGVTAVSDAWQITVLVTEPTARPAPASELALVQIGYSGEPPAANRLLTCLQRDSFQDVAGSRVLRHVQFGPLPFQHLDRAVCLLPGGQ